MNTKHTAENIMNTKEEYRLKIKSDLENAQKKLDDFKAEVNTYAADVRVKYSEQVNDLVRLTEKMEDKLKELADAGVDNLEQLKDSADEHSKEFNTTVENAFRKLNSALA